MSRAPRGGGFFGVGGVPRGPLWGFYLRKITPAEGSPGGSGESFCVWHRNQAPEGRSRPAEPQDAGPCAMGRMGASPPCALPRVGFCQPAADSPGGAVPHSLRGCLVPAGTRGFQLSSQILQDFGGKPRGAGASSRIAAGCKRGGSGPVLFAGGCCRPDNGSSLPEPPPGEVARCAAECHAGGKGNPGSRSSASCWCGRQKPKAEVGGRVLLRGHLGAMAGLATPLPAPAPGAVSKFCACQKIPVAKPSKKTGGPRGRG